MTTYAGAEAPAVATQTFGSDPTPMQVHLGIVGDPRTSIVAQWRTKDEATRATTVRLGVGANLGASALTDVRSGITFAYRSTGAQVYRMHQAHLCGLTAGTTYSYQVGSIDLAGAEHFSPVYTFHTAPDIAAHPDAQVVLAFVGDSRGGYDVWQQLIDQIKQRTPDLILFSGDAVTVGITQLEWEDFFTRAEPLFATVPVIAANGNTSTTRSTTTPRWRCPAISRISASTTASRTSPWATTRRRSDGAHRRVPRRPRRGLRRRDSARWKLFMHHQPIFSASTKHGSSLTLAQAWQPLIDAHHIDLVLNGHDHDFEITKPMIGMTVQNGAAAANATVYVVAGGAGAELYPNGTQFWTAYSESTYSAAIINIARGQLTLDAFHPDGTPIPNGSFSNPSRDPGDRGPRDPRTRSRSAAADPESDADAAFRAAQARATAGDPGALDALEALGRVRPITRWTDDAWAAAARLAERGGDLARARADLAQVVATAEDDIARRRAEAALARIAATAGEHGQWDQVSVRHDALAAEILGGAGDPKPAMRELAALVQLHPDYPGATAARLAIAQGWERDGDPAAALAILDEAIAAAPSPVLRARARYAAFRARLHARELDDARADLDAIAASPGADPLVRRPARARSRGRAVARAAPARRVDPARAARRARNLARASRRRRVARGRPRGRAPADRGLVPRAGDARPRADRAGRQSHGRPCGPRDRAVRRGVRVALGRVAPARRRPRGRCARAASRSTSPRSPSRGSVSRSSSSIATG